MRIFVPVPLRAASSGAVRQPRSAHWKIASQRGPLRRVRRFIESDDRVERCVCARWVDGACIGAVVVSLLYFLPLLMPLLIG